LFFNLFKTFEGGVDMCKKLSVFCIALLVVTLAVPALAAPTGANPLKIDINGDTNDVQGPGRTQPGWQAWNMLRSPATGPITKNFTAQGTLVQVQGFRFDGGGVHGTRNRSGMSATNLGQVHNGLFFMSHSGLASALNGMDYIKTTIAMGTANAGKTFQVTMWSWDPAFAGSGISGFGGAGEPAGSKKATYSLSDPRAWCQANGLPMGYDVNGIPAGLAALVVGQNLALGINPQTNPANAYTYSSTFNVTLNASGQVAIYSWLDQSSFSGSQHIPLNGIMIVPEPTTVALLGLGGLSLLRRRKR